MAISTQASEGYLLRKICESHAKDIGEIIGALWQGNKPTYIDSRNFADDGSIVVQYPSQASVATFRSNWDTLKNPRMKLVFKKIKYDPNLSNYHYGTPSMLESGETPVSGHSYLYDLRNESEDGEFNQTDEVTLSETRSMEVTHGVTFDLTVSSETTVSGSYGGVELEQKITAEAGYSNSKEETKGEEESKDKTESHEFDVDLKAGYATLIALTTEKVTTATPFKLDLVADYVLEIHLPFPHIGMFNDYDGWKDCGGSIFNAGHHHGRHWANVGEYNWQKNPPEQGGLGWFKHLAWWKKTGGDWLMSGKNSPMSKMYDGGWPENTWFMGFDNHSDANVITFESLDKFRQFLQGTHEDYQAMEQDGKSWINAWGGKKNPWSGAQFHSEAALERIMDPTRRVVSLEGTQRLENEDTLKEVVQAYTSDGDVANAEAKYDPQVVSGGDNVRAATLGEGYRNG